MGRVVDKGALDGGRVEGMVGLEGLDLEFGVEAGGDGGEVGSAGGRVAKEGAGGVQFKMADAGKEVGCVGGEEGGEGAGEGCCGGGEGGGVVVVDGGEVG